MKDKLSDIINLTTSLVAGVFKGAPLSFQSGNSSFKAVGSKTFPESICAPISDPFSRTHTEISLFSSLASCFIFIAEDKPEGPPPMTKTSYSMTSLSTCSLIFSSLSK